MRSNIHATSCDRRRFLLTAGAALCGASLRRLDAADEVSPVDQRIQQMARDAPLQMQFRGHTADECRAWQAAFTAKLRSLLGPFQPPKTWTTTVERTVEYDDHRRQELVLSADGHPPLPVHLLLPKEKSGKRLPGVLALHGHGAHGYDSVAGKEETAGVAQAIKSVNYDYGRQLARRGYVVAVPCFTPFGRRLGDRTDYGRDDPCAITFIRLQLLGKLLIAENLRDALWALELLAGQDRVDPTRLGCVGLSYGGRMTMLTTALEPRIRTAVISGAMNCMQERIGLRYSCGAQVIPGLLQFGDVPEIGSLIAPRPCVWELGLQDKGMPAKYVEVITERVGRAYAAFDAKDRLRIDRFEGGHRWNGVLGYPLLDKVLKG